MELTKEDKDILQCWLDDWGDLDSGLLRLYGHISYRDVDTLVKKLGLESPDGLEDIMSGAYEKRMQVLVKDIKSDGI